MLRPNFNTAYIGIVTKLSNKQSADLNDMNKGNAKNIETKFVKYPVFVIEQIQDGLTTDNPDTVTMNQNLDYLLNQWDY